jgi:threonine dehydratase
MPETAPEVKKNAVAGYGAEITFCKPTLENHAKVLHGRSLKEQVPC